MKVIKVTSQNTQKTPIYINVDMIGHFYEMEYETSTYTLTESTSYTTHKGTCIYSTTHSSGCKVTESISEVIKKIKNARELEE